METPTVNSVEVRSQWDLRNAKLLAEQVATELAFGPQERDEIAIVISELGTNLVKHAGGGFILVTPLSDNGQKGIKIESVDDGPGIADIAKAVTDGFSSSNSLGVGLGAINRLMDKQEIISPLADGRGTKIICVRYVRCKDYLTVLHCPLELGAATRNHPLAEVNGDAFLIKNAATSVTIAVIDGLGHGEYARQAAWTAREYIEKHYDQPLDAVFSGTGISCSGTRGVVLAIVRFTWDILPAQKPPIIKFTHASVGNIECKFFGNPYPIPIIVRRGVVGVNAPKPVLSSHIWDPEMILVMHSDGLRTNWRWSDFPELADMEINRVAATLLHRLAKEDDATVVVVRTKK
ncbi:MAG TPA: anti-sigma regulatory factor [Negativicutes bacterium]|nr:anti-sigma regulatory factor [Negativicutes bacterium]